MTTSSHAAPPPYAFGDLFIGGAWRSGNEGTTYADIDPYTGETLVEIAQASVADVEAAFAAAAVAQRNWAATTPSARTQVLRRAAAIMEDRHEEIVHWLIKESGSVRIKAELEWSAVR